MDIENIKIYEQTFKAAEQPEFLLSSTRTLCRIFNIVSRVLVEEEFWYKLFRMLRLYRCSIWMLRYSDKFEKVDEAVDAFCNYGNH